MNKHLVRWAGFTLIEMVVIIGVLTLLTSFLILYGRTGERQIILLRDKAKVINIILRAKSLAISTLVEDEPACGYGVYIESSRYLVFKDKSLDCASSDRIYSGEASGEKLVEETFDLDPALRFSEIGAANILFVPPDPKVFLDGGQTLNEAKISIVTVDNRLKADIIINNAGQVSSQ
mgnify:CR=1 FL=1